MPPSTAAAVTLECRGPDLEALGRLCRPVPGRGRGVCPVCRGCPHPGYALCFSCAQVQAQLSRPCTPVVPVSLYRIPGPLHQVLRRYKDGATARARDHDAAVLARLLDRFLADHGPCLERRAGQGWDLLTTVPSTVGRPGRHPLEEALDTVPWLAARRRSLVVPTAVATGHNRASDRAFAVTRAIRGASVVVVDDTYTSGARAQSAAAALRRAGAAVAAIVPVGRVVDPAHGHHAAAWWAHLSAQPYDFTRCCLEADGDRP